MHFLQVGDLIDARDESVGAWFESRLVRVTKATDHLESSALVTDRKNETVKNESNNKQIDARNIKEKIDSDESEGRYKSEITKINDILTEKDIVVNGAPTVSFSPNSLSVCNLSPSYTLDFAQSPRKPVYSVAPYAPNSYLWTITGTGVTAADYSFIGETTISSAYPQIIFNAFKTYTIEVKVDGNCIGSNIATFTFALKELPNLIINSPIAVCSPSTIDITVPAITTGSESGLDLTYWTDASATIALSTPSAITVSGTYYIKGTKTNGCPIIKPVTETNNKERLPIL